MRKAIPKIIEFRDVGSYSDLPEEYAYGIRKCVSNAFGGGVTEDDALSHIMGEQVLVGIDYSDTKYTNVVGFSALSLNTTFFEIGQSHAYFAAAAIAKSHQGSGLYSILNDRRMDFVEEKKWTVLLLVLRIHELKKVLLKRSNASFWRIGLNRLRCLGFLFELPIVAC